MGLIYGRARDVRVLAYHHRLYIGCVCHRKTGSERSQPYLPIFLDVFTRLFTNKIAQIVGIEHDPFSPFIDINLCQFINISIIPHVGAIAFALTPILPFWARLLYAGYFGCGMCPMWISLAVTVFFMDYVDKNYFFTDFFAKSMYTSYIIHMSFPLQVGIKCWLLILEATNNAVYVDNSWEIENGNLVFPCFLLVSAITLIITWPLAYAIRSIPGFSQVL